MASISTTQSLPTLAELYAACEAAKNRKERRLRFIADQIGLQRNRVVVDLIDRMGIQRHGSS